MSKRTLQLGKNEIEAFRAGDYPQGSYPPERVDRIVANYASRGHRAPLAPNHDCSKGEAMGFVESVRAQWHDVEVKDAAGNVALQPVYSMIAKVKPSTDYVHGVRDNKWPGISIGLEYTGEDLNHIAPLGTKSPQVKGMAMPMFAQADGTFTLNFEEDTFDGLAYGVGELIAFDTVPGESPVDTASLADERSVFAFIRGLASLFNRTRSGPITPLMSDTPSKEDDVTKEEVQALLNEQRAAMQADFDAKLTAATTQFAATLDAQTAARTEEATRKTRVKAAVDRLFFQMRTLKPAQYARLTKILEHPSVHQPAVQFAADGPTLSVFDAIVEVFALGDAVTPTTLESQPGREFAGADIEQGPAADSPDTPRGLDRASFAAVSEFERELDQRVKAHPEKSILQHMSDLAIERPDLTATASGE